MEQHPIGSDKMRSSALSDQMQSDANFSDGENDIIAFVETSNHMRPDANHVRLDEVETQLGYHSLTDGRFYPHVMGGYVLRPQR